MKSDAVNPKPDLKAPPGTTPVKEWSDAAQGVLNVRDRNGNASTVIDPAHARRMAEKLGPVVEGAVYAYGQISGDGIADLGRVMNHVKSRVPGTTDGDVLHALSQMWTDKRVEMKVLNEVRSASDADRTRNLRRDGNEYAFVILGRAAR